MLTEQELLLQTDHRPYQLPNSSYIGYQQWHDVLFLHCPVAPSLLAPEIPPGLQVDVYDEQAWCSVVAFTNKRTGPRYLLHHPSLRDFQEIHIRTYVKNKQHTGIYMLSMAANHSFFVWLARQFFNLPDHKTEIRAEKGGYQCTANLFHLEVNYTTGRLISRKSGLEKWLTERYALFVNSHKGLFRMDIQHMEWHLKMVDLPFAYFYYNSNQLSLSEKDIVLAHYGCTQQVLLWRPVPVKKYELLSTTYEV